MCYAPLLLRRRLKNSQRGHSVWAFAAVLGQCDELYPSENILLFNVFINDIVSIANDAKFIMYADDCTLCVSGPDANKLVEKCNEIMVSLSDWTQANKLKVNSKKTKVIVFRAKNKPLVIHNDIYFQNQRIELVEELKILGVYFSSSLRWDTHINYLCGKLSAVTGAMARCRAFLPTGAKLQIYYGLFLSYVHYCYFVWATTSKCNMQKLVIIQKKIVRYIENVDRLSATHCIFLKHKLHRVDRLYEYRLLEKMYFSSKNVQNYFTSLAKLEPHNNTKHTRNPEVWKVPWSRNNYSLQSLTHNIPTILNRYKHTATLNKKHLRDYFLSL